MKAPWTRGAAGLALLVALLAARGARGDVAPTREVLDRAVVRFYSPETGGTARPRFVDERTLAFEARLESMAERPEGIGDGYQERHVRAALEHHVAEEMLASLAHKLIAGLPVTRRPSDADLARVRQDLGRALFERLGGQAAVEAAATAEQLDALRGRRDSVSPGSRGLVPRPRAVAHLATDRRAAARGLPELRPPVPRTALRTDPRRPGAMVRAGANSRRRERVLSGARTRVTVVVTR